MSIEFGLIVDRAILGRFNWSSQHPYGGSCDEQSETGFWSSKPAYLAIPWASASFPA